MNSDALNRDALNREFLSADRIAHAIIEDNSIDKNFVIDQSAVFDVIRGKTVDEVFWLILRSRAFAGTALLVPCEKRRVPALKVSVDQYTDFNERTVWLAAGMLVDYCESYDNMMKAGI